MQTTHIIVKKLRSLYVQPEHSRLTLFTVLGSSVCPALSVFVLETSLHCKDRITLKLNVNGTKVCDADFSGYRLSSSVM
jgi:NifU-like protein involved in Fe-S cluster formation